MDHKALIYLTLLCVSFAWGQETDPKKGVNSLNATLTERLAKFDKLAREMASSMSLDAHNTPGWLKYGKYQYWVSDRTMRWEEAQYVCTMRNARLASKGLREDDVYNFLRHYIVELDISSSGGHWVGLTDIRSEGNWVYGDGVEALSSNTKWNPGEPNDHKGEDCAELTPSREYLNDVDCGSSRRALCEFDLD